MKSAKHTAVDGKVHAMNRFDYVEPEDRQSLVATELESYLVQDIIRLILQYSPSCWLLLGGSVPNTAVWQLYDTDKDVWTAGFQAPDTMAPIVTLATDTFGTARLYTKQGDCYVLEHDYCQLKPAPQYSIAEIPNGHDFTMTSDTGYIKTWFYHDELYVLSGAFTLYQLHDNQWRAITNSNSMNKAIHRLNNGHAQVHTNYFARPAIVVVHDKFYIIGGCEDEMYRKQVSSYDPQQNVWRAEAQMSQNGGFVSAIEVNNVIYAVGGRTNNKRSRWLERWDPQSDAKEWQVLAPSSRERCCAGLVAIGQTIYLLGGHNFDVDEMCVAECYDIASGKWSFLQNIPRGFVRGLAAVVS